MERILVVVSCGDKKIWTKYPNVGPVPACDAYTGPYFTINKKYAEKSATRWVILSAKHGFVPPDFIIPGPYNVSFKKRGSNPVSISILRDQINAQKLESFEMLIGLGGKEYRDILEEAFALSPVKLCFPFKGLRLGNAMHATNRAVELGELCPQF